MPSVRISCGGGREEGGGEACEQNAVQPGGDVGEKEGRHRGLLDVLGDGLHLKRGAFTFCSPLLLKNPHIPFLSVPQSLPSSASISRKGMQQYPKMLPVSRRITLDRYRLCHRCGHCGQKLPVLTIVHSCVCRSSQVILLVLLVHEDSSCYCMYTLQ